MASKWQRFNSYSTDFRKEILKKYLNNQETALYLSKQYNILVKTINNWIYKHKHGNDVPVDHKLMNSGNKKDETIDYKEKYEIPKNYQAFLKAQREKK